MNRVLALLMAVFFACPGLNAYAYKIQSKARVSMQYEVVLGGRVSADPLGHAASMDLYSAFNGDGINHFDPDGRFATGVKEGYSGSVGANSLNSSATQWGRLFGGSLSGGAQGVNDWQDIVADETTFHSNDALHAYANTLQGTGYDLSRNLLDGGLVGLGGAAIISTGGMALEGAGIALESSPSLWLASARVSNSALVFALGGGVYAGGNAVQQAEVSAETIAAEGGAPIQVTEESIAKALEGSTMQTAQGQVSLPAVQRYVRMLEEGKVAPPIKVDGNVIVEGNHRYIAGRVFGTEPAITPGTLSPSQIPKVIPIQETVVDPFDWGNH